MSTLSIVTHLHLHDCTATVWRWGLDGHMMAFISNTGAICLTLPDISSAHCYTSHHKEGHHSLCPCWRLPLQTSLSTSYSHRAQRTRQLLSQCASSWSDWTSHRWKHLRLPLLCQRSCERADVSVWGSHSRLQGSYVHVDPNDKINITRLLQKNLRSWRQRGVCYILAENETNDAWECFMTLNLPTI